MHVYENRVKYHYAQPSQNKSKRDILLCKNQRQGGCVNVHVKINNRQLYMLPKWTFCCDRVCIRTLYVSPTSNSVFLPFPSLKSQFNCSIPSLKIPVQLKSLFPFVKHVTKALISPMTKAVMQLQVLFKRPAVIEYGWQKNVDVFPSPKPQTSLIPLSP